MYHDRQMQIDRTRTVLYDIHDYKNVAELDHQVSVDVRLKTRVESKKRKP